MKKYFILLSLLVFFGISLQVHAQGNSLAPGWYYTETGSPLYYYPNGIYYDPSTQSYGGTVLYPSASGPLSSEPFTPGVPNTGVGVTLYAWLSLIISAVVAVVGARYLTRGDVS